MVMEVTGTPPHMRQEQNGTWVASPDEATALQNVADRVSSWQDGADDQTVHEEFGRVAQEVGIDVPGELAEELCRHIEDRHERPDVQQYVTVST